MKVAVFGAGAVGGYFGGRLAEAGEDVKFIARGATLDALRERGLGIESPAGDFHLGRAAATDDPVEVGPVDLVLVGVKAWQVPLVAREMRALVGPATAVLPLQNGVEAVGQLSDALGADRVLGGLCRILARVEEPGRVRHLGADPEIVLGEQDDRHTARVERIRDAFAGARGARATIADDIQAEIWKKFTFIAAASAVGAATRAPVGVIRELPETRALLERSMRETIALAAAHGVDLPHELPERLLTFLDGLPPEGTSSMQRDLEEGRPSELESQIGAVSRLGRARGVATPASDALYAVLLPLEERARGRLSFQL